MTTLHFPDGFGWGIGVSGYQTEGGDPHSNWAHWERRGKTKERLGPALDSWNRFEEDWGLVSEALGCGRLRMSVEWSRIEPEPGRFDDLAMAHYLRMIDAARARGLQVSVTLSHYTIPQWLEAAGGWSTTRSVAAFERYAAHVAVSLGRRVRDYYTFNEPNGVAVLGYLVGSFPPGRNDPFAYQRVWRNLRDAHRVARLAIRQARPGARVSFTIFEAHERADAKGFFAFDLNKRTGMAPFVHAVAEDDALDFVALDYYYGYGWFNVWKAMLPNEWPVYPEGLRAACLAYGRRYGKPIVIAENGLATNPSGSRSDGWNRERYLEAHLKAIHQAIQDGAPVEAYHHWTLADSYEWVGTYGLRFGLYHVDRKDPDLKRVATPAAARYAAIAKSNGI